MRVLVTGATGYIGGRLVPRLLEQGHSVRVLVRDPGRIAGRPWADQVEVASGDLLSGSPPTAALADVDAAYYLVHSMYAGRHFARLDQQAARQFCAAAGGVQRVIYLGGLTPADAAPSAHLRSRAEVGQVLRDHLPTTEFRAGPIIGSGSASFEMVRYLTERLPVMLAPRWVLNRVAPLAVRDVLAYLLAALATPPLGVVDVGAEPLRFLDMMLDYAAVRGLRRRVITVPVLAPRLAALWTELVTPIPNRLAVPLVEGLTHDLLADTAKARAAFPQITPLPYRRAVELAVQRVAEQEVETRWSGALGAAATVRLSDWEGLIREERSVHVAAPPERVFATFTGLGGERGWLVWDWAWRLRGLLDRLLGGPGLRRGRRDPADLLAGEALDFWRVEDVQPPRLLRLRAEMKVPGRAWLQFETHTEGDGARLVQTALFAPRGLGGALYWYLLYPLHKLIFTDMVKAVARAAEHTPTAPPGPP